MVSQRRILIVSASAGSGHVRAADALREHIHELGAHVAVEHVDILELAPAWVRHAYGGGFELIAARATWVWRELYAWTDGPDADLARWGPLAGRLLFRAFRQLAAAGPWDLVLCTHFLPCQLAAGRRGFPPFALVVTDYSLHRYWVQPGVATYFVATESQRNDLRARTSVPVHATGIPVSPAFVSARSTRWSSEWLACRARLGLDPLRPVVLVMGGGFGLGVEAAADAALGTGIDRLQLIVVCGRNAAAYQRLADVSAEAVRVYGRVNNVADLMAAADVIVTKPGGLTTTEALVCGRPLVLTRALPGHEEGNAGELVSFGAALSADDAAAVSAALRQLFERSDLLARMTAASVAAGRPAAGRDIAALTLGGITTRVAA